MFADANGDILIGPLHTIVELLHLDVGTFKLPKGTTRAAQTGNYGETWGKSLRVQRGRKRL